jgi:hypothetical protein
VIEEALKLKMSNHVERKYMIVVVFDCKDVNTSGVELTLNVSETMRLLPDGWEEFFVRACRNCESDHLFQISVCSDRIILQPVLWMYVWNLTIAAKIRPVQNLPRFALNLKI